jgi:hypothetical protein
MKVPEYLNQQDRGLVAIFSGVLPNFDFTLFIRVPTRAVAKIHWFIIHR